MFNIPSCLVAIIVTFVANAYHFIEMQKNTINKTNITMKNFFTLGLLCSSILLNGQVTEQKFTALRHSLLKSDGYANMLDRMEFQSDFGSGWETEMTYKFFYNEAGKVHKVEETSTDGIEYWKLTYNKNGLLSELMQGESNYDAGGNELFVALSKEVYEYDAEGKEIVRTLYAADDDLVMIATGKIETTYETGVVSHKSFNWDLSSKTWIPSTSTYNSTLVYNGEDLVRDTVLIWDEAKAAYSPQYYHEYTYSAGVLASETKFQWGGSSFVNSTKTDYKYDTHGNCMLELNSKWNTATSVWDSVDRYEKSYDLTINMAQTAFTAVSEFEADDCVYNNAPVASVYKYWSKNILETEGRTVYVFSDFKVEVVTPSTATSETEKSISVEYYPVPATDLITITAPVDNGTLTMTDSDGNVVYSGTFSNTMQISVSGLTRGMYVCTICSGDAVFSDIITVE